MRISKPLALLIGIVTIWPLIYMLGFMAFIAFQFSQVTFSSPASSADGFRYLLILHMTTMLVMLGLLVFYVMHVFQNAALRDERKTLWALVLFLGGPVSMPVYWWLYLHPSS
jgi:hypothetical protein